MDLREATARRRARTQGANATDGSGGHGRQRLWIKPRPLGALCSEFTKGHRSGGTACTVHSEFISAVSLVAGFIGRMNTGRAMPKITDPQQVKVTPEIQKWSSKRFGCPFLPNVFLKEFHESCAARGPKYKDAEQAFRNWITWSSPGQRFYRAGAWEEKLRRARKLEHGPRTSREPETVAGQYVERPRTERSSGEVARAALDKMRRAIT